MVRLSGKRIIPVFLVHPSNFQTLNKSGLADVTRFLAV
jgi:hypothetical protein